MYPAHTRFFEGNRSITVRRLSNGKVHLQVIDGAGWADFILNQREAAGLSRSLSR